MRKLGYVLLAVLLMFSMVACEKQSETGDDNQQKALSSVETTQEEIADDFGFVMTPPQNAKDAKWAVVDECIGELTFKLDGQNVAFRITTDDAPEAESDALVMMQTISGINEELAKSETGNVGDMNAFVFFNSGKSGAVIWYSDDNIIYTVAVDKKASSDNLLELAQTLDRLANE